MARCTTDSFTLTLRLDVNKNQTDILDKHFSVGCHLYNIGVKEAKKRLNKLYKDKGYQTIIKAYAKNKKFIADQKSQLSSIRDKYNLTGQYSFEKYLNKGRQKYSCYIDADTCAVIANTVWKSVESNIFGNGEDIYFKKNKDFNSLASKSNKQGIIYRYKRIKWIGLDIPVIIQKNDNYAIECLDNHRIKFCRIKRKWHKHNYRYYAELVFEGIPPQKNRKYGNGRVGIDIGTSTIAAVSNKGVMLKELNDGVDSIDKEIAKLNRKADRQRRANNPDNYNPDGTIRRKSKTFKRKWIISSKQKITYDKLKELNRIRSDKLKQFQNELANEIVSMGNDIVIEAMNIQGLQKRSKNTEISDKTKRYKKKKRFGKSIQIHAPAALIQKVKRRVQYCKGTFTEINTFKVKASQFNHITGEYMSSELNKRWKELITGTKVQRDLYSAFLLYNALDEETIDIDRCSKTFDNFYELHNNLINEMRMLKTLGKHYPSCMGI